nr:MAG TPA: YjcQ protein [Caudoviricetes sp.]
MDKYKFLKAIYDKDSVIPENNNLYSSDNVEVQTVLKLNEEELVNYHVGLNSNAQDYYMKDYRITDKGKEYVDKHSPIKFTKDKLEPTLSQIIVGVLITVIGSIILYYLGFK